MHNEEIVNINSSILSKLLESVSSISGSLAVHSVKKAVMIESEVPEKRLLMIVPKSNDAAKWLAVAKTLMFLTSEDTYSSIENLRFSKGETILLNNCVVIFEDLLKDKNMIVVKCSDGNYTMPLSYVHTLTSTQNKKLHSMNYLLRVTNTKNRKKSKSQFFGLSGFVSKSNYIVLVTRSNDSEFFISNNCIEDVQVRQLFPWGKIKKSGEVEVLGPHSKSDKPNCLISPDLDRLYTFLNKAKQMPELIIFDGFHQYINQLYVFDDILQFNIPFIVIAEESELPDLGHLYDRDFKEIRIRNHPDFNFQIDLNEVYFTELTDVYKAIKIIKKKYHEYSSSISELLDSLSILTYQFSRLLFSMPPDFQKSKSERLNHIKSELERSGMWIPKELKYELLQLVDKLNQIQITSENAAKMKAIFDLVNREDQGKKHIVVRTQSDARYYNVLFESFGLKRLKAVTMSELLSRSGKVEKLIVFYWPGQNQVFKLLTSYAFQSLSFIYYPHEMEWLKNRLKQWHNEYGLDFNYSEPNASINRNLEHQEYTGNVDVDLEDLEFRVITRRYHLLTKPDGSTESLCKSKLVIFNSSHYAFFTDQQRLLVVTDLIYETGEEIERKVVNELQFGDIVLFRDSDNDLIREIADVMLKQNNMLHLRSTASIWRDALLRRYKALDESIRRLKRELKANGCNRHEITIRNWLLDDSMIGPRDMNDIVLISRATMDKELNEKLQQVLDAVSTLRSVHIQAASYLNKQLISNLPDMMGNVSKSFSRVVTLKLDQYGTVSLASVDRVSDEYTEVSLSATYKLFPLE